MKLRNKKTGEIIDDGYVRETHDFQFDGQKHVLAVFKGNGHRPPEMVSGAYKSLAELNKEWEDYEEPTTYYYISDFGSIRKEDVGKFVDDEMLRKEIGNYFGTKEEAEKAVERLETWRQLKDRRLFRFDGYDVAHKSNGNLAGQIFYDAGNYCIGDVEKYLDLLFGGENE